MSKQSQTKVVVLGASGVGKSSILLRFVNQQFNQFNEPTLGAAFLSKVHTYGNNQSIRFQVWDTAGQQKYASIAPIYYRDSQVAICVYDITNKNSFEKMKQWVEDLKAQGPKDLVLAVVGNKTDLIDNEKVSYEEAKNYARDNGAVFKLVSAKEGRGINELFTQIAEQLDLNSSKRGSKPEVGGKVNLAKKIERKGCC